MRLTLASEADRLDFDAYVASRPESTFYHRFAWRDAVMAAYGEQPVYLVARSEEGAIVGTLPLFLVRTPFGRPRVLSLPHAPIAGLLADDPAGVSALTVEAVRLAEELAGGRMVWRNPVAPVSDPNWPGLATYRLSLPETADALWRNFRPEIRNRTRKAEKVGVTIAEGRYLLPDFCRIYERHMHELGTPPHPPSFFAALADAEPNRVTVSVASLEGTPMAGMIRVGHGHTVTAVWVSSLPGSHAASPVNLLYWRALEAAVAEGARVFDFGRGRPGTGPTIFKIRYGAVPHPLTQQVYPSDAKDVTISPTLGTISRLWRHLPFALATWLGHRARRYLS